MKEKGGRESGSTSTFEMWETTDIRKKIQKFAQYFKLHNGAEAAIKVREPG